jgi:hypothetical protein
MLIGCKVGVLVGVRVGLVVAVGRGVLLGDGVLEGDWVALGMAVVAVGLNPAVRDAVFSTTELHPVMIKNKNSPNVIPAIIMNLFLPVCGFISGVYSLSMLL